MDLLSSWHLWLIAGLVAGALEIKLSGFVMLWFAVGAFASSLVAGLGFGLTSQLAAFTLVSAALFAASRTVFQKWFMRSEPEMAIGAEAMSGAEATVTEALPERGYGTVRINGELWSAHSLDGPVPVGEIVRIESREGLKLRVRKSSGETLSIVGTGVAK
jgi:membrane protein implicated in regulation of membrane protease activity